MIWKYLDSCGKWEMIKKNPYGFETVQKMGNDLEKSGQLVGFFCYTRKKIPDEPKNFRVAMLPCYPGFWASKVLVCAIVSSNYQSRKKSSKLYLLNKIAILANLNRISKKENHKNLEKLPAHVWSLCACLATLLTS